MSGRRKLAEYTAPPEEIRAAIGSSTGLPHAILDAVSLQPGWAALVIHGVLVEARRPGGKATVRRKGVELRTWAPPPEVIGKRIAIHASASISGEGRLPVDMYGLDEDEIAKGRIVGTVRLVRCRPATLADNVASMLPDLGPSIAAAREKGRVLLAWELADPMPLAADPRLRCKGTTGHMFGVNLGFLPAEIWT